MKTYYFHYSLLGSGVLEVKANSLEEADILVMNVSDEILVSETDFKRGLKIEYVEDEDGKCYEDGEYDEEELEEISENDEIAYIVT